MPVVSAPNDCDRTANGAVLSVLLGPNERVQWAHTILPDGRRVATGYDILPILPDPPAAK